jgi:hypothetical protein
VTWPTAEEVWFARLADAIHHEPRSSRAFQWETIVTPGGHRSYRRVPRTQSERLMRALDEIDWNSDDPRTRDLLDELGDALGIGPVPPDE